jgi:hypothetical protein
MDPENYGAIGLCHNRNSFDERMSGLGLLKKPIVERAAWVLFAFSLTLDVITTLFLVYSMGLQAEENYFLRMIFSWNPLLYIPVACTAYVFLYAISRHFKNKSQAFSITGRDIVYLIFLSIPLSLAFVEFIIAYHNLYLILGAA